MKPHRYIYTCLLLAINIYFFASCKSNNHQVQLKNPTIVTAIETAKAEGKGLLLISNKAGCSMCEFFEVDLMKDEAYAQQVYSKFVITRVDENVISSQWLGRIINRSAFPIYLFFNKTGDLQFVDMGMMKKSKC